MPKRSISVFAQTYKDIELVVVNDASYDGTEEYLRSRAQGEPRLIHVSNSEPRGAGASRNIAILKSKGTFVTGLDDDDQFLPERIGAFIDYWKLLTLKESAPLACTRKKSGRVMACHMRSRKDGVMSQRTTYLKPISLETKFLHQGPIILTLAYSTNNCRLCRISICLCDFCPALAMHIYLTWRPICLITLHGPTGFQHRQLRFAPQWRSS